MPLRISLCPYRLLFRHPFGTAHGLRDGTDALFIRLEEDGVVGYGEVTLPPYLTETVSDAIERMRALAARGPWTGKALYGSINHLPEFQDPGHGCRAGLHMALIDLIGKERQLTARELLDIPMVGDPITLMTIGISPPGELAMKVAELPMSGALKVKVGDAAAAARIRALRSMDDRKLLLDGNQGIGSVLEAQDLVRAAGPERVIAFEQPFPTTLDELNLVLHEATGIDVFSDESVQGLDDLRSKQHLFSGVNIKLMKCGGMDRALALANQARSVGLKVMLGSMSESSLGCTAMAQLITVADIVDLDGPWLIKNDPFRGMAMEHGKVAVMNSPGLGVALVADLQLDHIGL